MSTLLEAHILFVEYTRGD